MRKIVHIAKATGIYGMEKHLLALLPALQQRYRVAFIVLFEKETPVAEYLNLLRVSGIEVFPVPITCDIDPKTLAAVAALLRRLRPDLVHTHLIHGDCYGIAAAAMAGCRVIVSTRHNDDAFRRRLPVRMLSRLLATRIRTLIAISDWVARFAATVEGIPAEKIIKIHYGIKPPRPTQQAGAVRAALGLSDTDVLLGITARLTRQKGHGHLLEAFALARKECPTLKLLIAGEGPLRSELETRIRDNRLDDAVFLTGYRSDIGDVLAALDVFVHPSLWEGFGLAILEAMAAGRPVVATNASAIPELVGDAGIAVPPGDIPVLARALTTLARDPSLRHALGMKARERHARLFTVDRMVRQTAAVYDAALAHP